MCGGGGGMSEVDFKILELREQITTLEVQRNELQMAMQAQLQQKQTAVEKRRSQARLLRRKEQLELAITLLSERKETSQAECEQLRASNDARRSALAHAKMRLAQARRETVDETLQPVTQALLWHYSEKAKKVSKLRRALIKQLVDLFQLGEDDEGKPTIVDIKLDPDRLTQGRDYRGDDRTPLENISSGLGWVVHFLQCVCTYLDVVPPHAMRFHGSKSTIGGLEGTNFELVADSNGIRQETFKIAIRMLNTNGACSTIAPASTLALRAPASAQPAHTCFGPCRSLLAVWTGWRSPTAREGASLARESEAALRSFSTGLGRPIEGRPAAYGCGCRRPAAAVGGRFGSVAGSAGSAGNRGGRAGAGAGGR